MDEKTKKRLRDQFIRGNEVYAGQKPNGTIARILKDQTWSEKYQKVVPRKGRYALLFQDVGGGGQVISFPPEQLKKALSDLKQQGYEQLAGLKPTSATTKEPWQMTQDEYFESTLVHGLGRRVSIKDIPPEGRESLIRFHQKYITKALAEGKPVPKKVLVEYPNLRMQVAISPKPRSLPPNAQNVQDLSFNSDKFTCYGKQTKRGFRAYCRRKEK